MAAPNLAVPTSIYGKTSAVALSTVNATSILSNAASSGKALRINTLYASNNDSAATYTITCNYYSAASLGGTAFAIATAIPVPPNTSLVIVTKDAPIYLEEDKSIGCTANSANKFTIIASYDEVA